MRVGEAIRNFLFKKTGAGILCVLTLYIAGLSPWNSASADSNPAGFSVVTEHTYPPIRATRDFWDGSAWVGHEVGFTVKIKSRPQDDGIARHFLIPPDGNADTGDASETNHVRAVYSYAGHEIEISIIDIVEVPGVEHRAVIVTNETGWIHWQSQLRVEYKRTIDEWHEVYARKPALRSIQRQALETSAGGTIIDNGDITGFGNIFNATLPLRLQMPGESYYSRNNYIPAAGLSARPVYRWQDGTVWYPVDWDTTDAGGNVSFTIGDGQSSVSSRDLMVSTPLYAKVFKGGFSEKQFTYPDLTSFTGTVHVTVLNKDGFAVSGVLVNLWGGHGGDSDFHVVTDQDGKASTPFPENAVGSASTSLEMTILPALDIEWRFTQVVDNPTRIVKEHNTPLYVSPMVSINREYPYTHALNNVAFQVYDVADPDPVLVEKTQSGLRKEDAYSDRDKYRGRNRSYIEADPELFTGRQLGVRAVYDDTDDGRRSNQALLGMAVDSQAQPVTLYESKKPVFRFAFVPLKIGAWETSGPSYNSSHLEAQIKFFRSVFPAKVNFTVLPAVQIPRRPGILYGMENDKSYLWHVFRTLSKLQKFYQENSPGSPPDVLVGLVPPKFLGAGGLQQAGHFGMNWEFLGAVHNAVLLDLSGADKHVTLHEFIHTLGFEDVYPSSVTGWKPLSANGHNGNSGINNIFSEGMISWTYFGQPAEAIMYDKAPFPWATDAEYDALLDYAVKASTSAVVNASFSSNCYKKQENNLLLTARSPSPPGRGPGVRVGEAISVKQTRESAVSALLIAGGAVNTRSSERQVFLDPPLPFTAEPDRGGNMADNPYVVQLIGAGGAVLEQGFFNDFEYDGLYKASFLLSLPSHSGIQAVEIGAHTSGTLTELWTRYDYSANAPAVSLTGPASGTLSGAFNVTWDASDADGDMLTSNLLISDDDGVSWRIIAPDISHNASSGSFSQTFNAGEFSAGSRYRFKVIVSDGLRFAEAESSGSYTIDGYNPSPVFKLDHKTITVNVLTGATEAVAMLPIKNNGGGTLVVQAESGSLSNWISPAFAAREMNLFPGETHRALIPLVLPAVSPAAGLEGTIRLESNDPDKPTATVTLKVVYLDKFPAPELESLITVPDSLDGGNWPISTLVQITAIANAGRSDLNASVTITEVESGTVMTNAVMDPSPEWPGAYMFSWNAVDAGADPEEYGARITFTDPASGLRRASSDFDFTFTLYNPEDVVAYEKIPVYRFYSSGAAESTYTHLWTVNETERDALIAWPSWQYEGIGWYALSGAESGATPLYRLYEPNIQRHLYTINPLEYVYLETTSWNGEGVQYYVYATNSISGLVPAYRFYHSVNQNHHFTIDENEKNTIIATPEWGYTYEGIAFYVFANQSSPSLRQSGLQAAMPASRPVSRTPRIKPDVAPAVSGDYTGNGVQDSVVYDENTGLWYIRPGKQSENSLSSELEASSFVIQWGAPGMIAVPGDYNGDAVQDLAVYELATGNWYIRTVEGEVILWAEQWGGAGFEPVAGDYDGNRIHDLTVYDASAGLWHIRFLIQDVDHFIIQPSAFSLVVQCGGIGYIPFAFDYTGNGISDLCVYCPETGSWFVCDVNGKILHPPVSADDVD